jgi:hypothetical protein
VVWFSVLEGAGLRQLNRRVELHIRRKEDVEIPRVSIDTGSVVAGALSALRKDI